MKRGKIICLGFIVLIVYINLIIAAEQTYTIPTNPRLYRADIITATKLCLQKSVSSYPILKEWSYDIGSQTCINGNKLSYFNLTDNLWKNNQHECVNGISSSDNREWAYITSITCKSRDSGEVSPLDKNLNFIVYNKGPDSTDLIEPSINNLRNFCKCKDTGYSLLFTSVQSFNKVNSIKRQNYLPSCGLGSPIQGRMTLKTQYLYNKIFIDGRLATFGNDHAIVCGKSSCTPKTCAEMGRYCGTGTEDRCGKSITCNIACPNIGEACDSATGKCSYPSCPQDQIIMNLTQKFNALGSFYNKGNTPYSICFKDIFGGPYGGANPHDCSGYNLVIGLSLDINAKATIPESSGSLTNKVCYGNLVCEKDLSPGATCSDNTKKVVLRLNAESDGMISDSSDSTFSVKICCKQSFIIGTAEWQNMLSNKIRIAHASDTVKLVLRGAGFSNKEIEFTIKKDSSTWYWPFDKKIASISSIGYTNWSINETGNNYYFVAKFMDGSVEKSYESERLNILAYNNFFPYTEIVKPINESNFSIVLADKKTRSISFEQISLDEDDDLKVTWNFDDNSIIQFLNCLTTTNCNTAHQYNKSGTKIASLKAEEMYRNQYSMDYARFYIFGPGMNIFAIIDKPSYGNETKDAGYYWIDGRSSYVANCSYEQSKCDLTAISYGKNCYEIKSENNPLNPRIYCYRHAESSQLGFQWTIDGTIIPAKTDSTPFEYHFLETKLHTIKLKVSYSY
ncbi:MAG: hypothetical protein Q8N99_00535 [Nanoarchaeota archaeon]|nr:hypothetical protein [Nanoarchaeota archaeon]